MTLSISGSCWVDGQALDILPRTGDRHLEEAWQQRATPPEGQQEADDGSSGAADDTVQHGAEAEPDPLADIAAAPDDAAPAADSLPADAAAELPEEPSAGGAAPDAELPEAAGEPVDVPEPAEEAGGDPVLPDVPEEAQPVMDGAPMGTGSMPPENGTVMPGGEHNAGDAAAELPSEPADEVSEAAAPKAEEPPAGATASDATAVTAEDSVPEQEEAALLAAAKTAADQQGEPHATNGGAAPDQVSAETPEAEAVTGKGLAADVAAEALQSEAEAEAPAADLSGDDSSTGALDGQLGKTDADAQPPPVEAAPETGGAADDAAAADEASEAAAGDASPGEVPEAVLAAEPAANGGADNVLPPTRQPAGPPMPVPTPEADAPEPLPLFEPTAPDADAASEADADTRLAAPPAVAPVPAELQVTRAKQ